MKTDTPTAVVPPCYCADIPDVNRQVMDELMTQELQNRHKAISAGDLLPADLFCTKTGMTPQALGKAMALKRIFALDGPGGTKVYPAFYAAAPGVREAFEKVSVALGELPGGGKWNFFRTPKISLQGETPAEAIRQGRVHDVLLTVSAFLGR